MWGFFHLLSVQPSSRQQLPIDMQLANLSAVVRTSLWAILSSSLVVLTALIIHRVVYKIAARISRRTSSNFDDSVLHHSERPARLILPVVFLLAYSPALNLSERTLQNLRHGLGIVLIAAIGWLLISLLNVFSDVLIVRFPVDVQDNLRARRIQTQVSVLQRVMYVVIVFITIAIILMTFPTVRHLGESLFASAGIAALVAGLAARPTFSSLIAGLQIALTEPIRLDDVVIVEGEWGRIERITTTYVVVRIWDDRRLIVPLSKFIEEPFQNWTVKSSDLLGTVFIYADYTVPVEALRQELNRILRTTNLWDQRVSGLQVTNASERTIELRALMSASDASKAWDLRCFVREKLIAFLQENYPDSLPRTRASLSPAESGRRELHKPEFALLNRHNSVNSADTAD